MRERKYIQTKNKMIMFLVFQPYLLKDNKLHYVIAISWFNCRSWMRPVSIPLIDTTNSWQVCKGHGALHFCSLQKVSGGIAKVSRGTHLLFECVPVTPTYLYVLIHSAREPAADCRLQLKTVLRELASIAKISCIPTMSNKVSDFLLYTLIV